MTVVRYQPWTIIDSLQRQLDQAFSTGTEESDAAADVAWIPPVDIYEEADRYVVVADIPGVEPKDIRITADKGLLTIRGEKRSREAPQSNARQRLERHAGVFLRTFTLPEGTDTDRIAAKQTHGVLEVVIPKQPQVQPRSIEVRAA
ncbi:MAG: Hsp20/alpha crystallin family protein [Steroidobacteraceae bacterium]